MINELLFLRLTPKGGLNGNFIGVHISCCIGNYNIGINVLLCQGFTPNGGQYGGNYIGIQQARLTLLDF